MQNRIDNIIKACLKQKDTNPINIFMKIASEDYVRIHGPEHHFLDGACVLTAFCNAGADVNLMEGLQRLKEESLKMPGAICGLWGVCASVTSVGAVLSFIDNTGPLSTDGSWGEHMKYTSACLAELSKIGGPRCCKRDGFVAIKCAVKYLNEHFGVSMDMSDIRCSFSHLNGQCIKERCPFFKQK